MAREWEKIPRVGVRSTVSYVPGEQWCIDHKRGQLSKFSEIIRRHYVVLMFGIEILSDNTGRLVFVGYDLQPLEIFATRLSLFY